MNETPPASEEPAPLRFSIDTPHGPLEGALDAPPGPMTLAEMASNALSLSSVAAAMAAKQCKEDKKEISCCKGCGACCRQLVPVSPAEALMLAELVEAMPEPRRSRVKQRFAEAETRLKEAGLWEKFEPMGTSDLSEEKHRAISRGYFSLWLDCPFLEDEVCGIHPYRPAVCREYLVTSPAENCRAPYEKPVDKLPVTAWVNVALAYVSAKVLGRRPQLMPLTAALDWTRKNDSARYLAVEARTLLGAMLERCGAGNDSSDPPGTAERSSSSEP